MSSNLNKCKAASIDFIVRDSDPEMAAVEDDIRKNLESIGITVNSRFLSSEEYINAELNGDYHILFTRTWGAPYDPHTYMSSWAVPSHVEYSAIGNLQSPLTRELLIEQIEKVQTELDPQTIQQQWHEILDNVHKQALFMPLWGTRIPYVINRRLIGFTPGDQAFSLPISSVQVMSGPSHVTVAPGMGSLFTKAGPMNPHQYSPNALWAQDWIYEGLVSYGQDGEIVPALAESWTIQKIESGQRVTFQLRQEVSFHDGHPWNCAAAKLNFDHVLSDTVRQRHQWLGLGKYLTSWTCTGEYQLVLETNRPFYPLLQELTYIRPLRFASPSAFAEGVDSHPDLHNSCEPGKFGSGWEFLEEDVTCLGLSAPIGTGPFRFLNRTSAADGTDEEVFFARNGDYWGIIPGIKTVSVVKYESTQAVEAALMSGELDMALGVGPLTAKQVQDLKFFHSDKFDVRHSDVIQHSLLVFNGNRSPTNDIQVRQAIIHAIDKATFLEQEFAGLEQPVTQLLPLTAPFCNVDLSPKWSYDPAKAQLLNCPLITTAVGKDTLNSGEVVGIVVACLILTSLLGLLARMIQRERTGKPIFAPNPNKFAIEA